MSKSKLNMQSSHSNEDNHFGFNLIDYIIQMDSDGNYQFLVEYGKTGLFAELADLKNLTFNLTYDSDFFIKDTFNFDKLENNICSNILSNQNVGPSKDIAEIIYLINFSIVDDSSVNMENLIFNTSMCLDNSMLLLKT